MDCFDKYPLRTVVISNIMTFSAYIIGLYIISFFGILWSAVYIAFCIYVEFKILSKSCPGCYYYGKRCAFGRGLVSPIFFKKRTKEFGRRKITMLDILPDFLVTLIPVIAGIYILLISFSIEILVAILFLLFITFPGNAFVHGSLACKHCKQGKLGCPALAVFSKKK